MKYSVDSMIAGLTEFRFVFTSAEHQSSGEYLSPDAEWNYNDVPHLHEVHELAEAVQGAIADDYAASIFIQKIGPFRFPMTVFIGNISRFENIYFTTLGPFILLIRTNWTTVGIRTTVVTKYCLGSGKWLKWTHKFVYKILASNYGVLMSADIPMRTRRGELRSRKYSFKGDTDGYGFDSSVKINSLGVEAPSELKEFEWQSEISQIGVGTTLIGADDNSGVQLIRQDNLIRVFPRICMHAGASLDFRKIENSCIKCPWHGKLIKPILTIDLNEHSKIYESDGIKIEVKSPMVFVRGIYKVETQRSSSDLI